MKVLGDGAKIEFRANFFNLFNKLNLMNIQNNITDVHFGQAQNAARLPHHRNASPLQLLVGEKSRLRSLSGFERKRLIASVDPT